jgi:hypothetical protein
MSRSGIERRQAPRVAASLPIQLGTQAGSQQAQLKDISQNGLCCSFRDAIPEMTLVRIDLRLPGQPDGHSVQGVVVRCARERGVNPPNYDVGVYFTEVSPDCRTAIAGFVAKGAGAPQPTTRPVK